jgi:hypothetical protein
MKTLKFIGTVLMLAAVAIVVAKFQWVLVIGSFVAALVLCTTKTLKNKLNLKGDK